MRFVLVTLLAVAAARAGTVAELVTAVRAGLAAKQADAELADTVGRLRLAERLEDAAIEQLQSEGAGPITVEQLERLREETEGLPKAKGLRLFEAPPPPSAQEQARLVEQARVYADRYTASLPDFVCTETIERYQERQIREPWRLRDVLTVDVTYTGKTDTYTLRAIDGRPSDRSYRSVGGVQSRGEFGSLLRIVFKKESQFTWERWSNLRGRAVHVFSYRIERKHSEYLMDFRTSFLKRYRGVVAMRGYVYIDREDGRVLRFSYEADDIPKNWPIKRTPAVLDYGYAEVAGASYLLPKRVDIRVFTKDGQSRNVTEFGSYRKFSSNTTVTFENK